MNDLKLLSFYIADRPFNHDSCISYYDGETVHYFSHERRTKRKHDTIKSPEHAAQIIRREWGISFDDMNSICVICTNIPYRESHPFFKRSNVVILDHHSAHHYSAKFVYPHDIKECKGLAIDGIGEDDVAWTRYENDEIVEKGIVSKHGSIGVTLVDFDLAYKLLKPSMLIMSPDIAGKLMGLQTYGKIDENTLNYLQENVKDIYHVINAMDMPVHDSIDAAKTLFYHFENILLDFFKANFRHDDTIFYSGGIAQNVLWNTTLRNHFPNLIVPPHCSDMGLSIGGLEYLRERFELPKFDLPDFPFMVEDEAPSTLPSDDTISNAAELLANDEIIAWYQGHGEVGPRALGNRSILMNPMIHGGKDLINNIKNREYFRPFGAIVLDEFKTEYFDVDESFDNPYMLYAVSVKSDNIGSVTHVDGTCRVQTLKNENPILRKLMEKFYDLTGCPVLLNTSLNIAGDPIMSRVDDVNKLLTISDLKYAFIGDEMIRKKIKLNAYS